MPDPGIGRVPCSLRYQHRSPPSATTEIRRNCACSGCSAEGPIWRCVSKYVLDAACILPMPKVGSSRLRGKQSTPPRANESLLLNLSKPYIAILSRRDQRELPSKPLHWAMWACQVNSSTCVHSCYSTSHDVILRTKPVAGATSSLRYTSSVVELSPCEGCIRGSAHGPQMLSLGCRSSAGRHRGKHHTFNATGHTCCTYRARRLSLIRQQSRKPS